MPLRDNWTVGSTWDTYAKTDAAAGSPCYSVDGLSRIRQAVILLPCPL